MHVKRIGGIEKYTRKAKFCFFVKKLAQNFPSYRNYLDLESKK